jgi:hypothetical protein
MRKHHNEGTSGQLSVSGQGSIDFRIDREPSEVEVFFEENDNSVVPCNPQQMNLLSWDVQLVLVDGFHEHHLIINWDVSGVEVVCWIVQY